MYIIYYYIWIQCIHIYNNILYTYVHHVRIIVKSRVRTVMWDLITMWSWHALTIVHAQCSRSFGFSDVLDPGFRDRSSSTNIGKPRSSSIFAGRFVGISFEMFRDEMFCSWSRLKLGATSIPWIPMVLIELSPGKADTIFSSDFGITWHQWIPCQFRMQTIRVESNTEQIIREVSASLLLEMNNMVPRHGTFSTALDEVMKFCIQKPIVEQSIPVKSQIYIINIYEYPKHNGNVKSWWFKMVLLPWIKFTSAVSRHRSCRRTSLSSFVAWSFGVMSVTDRYFHPAFDAPLPQPKKQPNIWRTWTISHLTFFFFWNDDLL